ncbi:MAG: hypothetical protein HY292_04540 [Planctomycetes bacterium]|nr:hypothetical protein [Planctomycetota bacterium]
MAPTVKRQSWGPHARTDALEGAGQRQSNRLVPVNSRAGVVVERGAPVRAGVFAERRGFRGAGRAVEELVLRALRDQLPPAIWRRR